MFFDLLFAAAGTAIRRHQLTLFDVKLFRVVHRPLMMAMAAKRLALVLFLERGYAKGKNLSHQGEFASGNEGVNGSSSHHKEQRHGLQLMNIAKDQV